jgi:hypothetical protein
MCDVPETCTGGSNAQCPPDLKSHALCRASVNVCDAPEYCDGVNNDCPADVNYPNTQICHNADPGQPCDINIYCTGNSQSCPVAFQPTSHVCRPSAGPCDVRARVLVRVHAMA